MIERWDWKTKQVILTADTKEGYLRSPPSSRTSSGTSSPRSPPNAYQKDYYSDRRVLTHLIPSNKQDHIQRDGKGRNGLDGRGGSGRKLYLQKKFEHQLTSIDFSWICSSSKLCQLIQESIGNDLPRFSIAVAAAAKERLNTAKARLDQAQAGTRLHSQRGTPAQQGGGGGGGDTRGHQAGMKEENTNRGPEHGEGGSERGRSGGGGGGGRQSRGYGGSSSHHLMNLEEFLRAIDLYRDLRGRLRREMGAQCVSNAWLKMTEIGVRYDLLDHLDSGGAAGQEKEKNNKGEGESRSKEKDGRRPVELVHFDNCALPGAFLSAVNHLRATQHPGSVYNWRASSLVPQNYLPPEKHTHGYEMYNPLGDDYGLYAENTSRWMMDLAPRSDGSQCTGDMTDVQNVLRLERLCSGAGVQLYSSDLGVSVGQDFNNQEEINSHPHLGQAVAGVLTLSEGGHFLVKHYTLFEPFSISLLVVLASLFQEFYVCKPVTSRPTNSESYLVGKRFKGLPQAVRAALLYRVENFSSSSFLPQEVMEVVMKEDPNGNSFEEMFRIWDNQSKYLSESLSLYNATRHGRLLDSWDGLNRLKREREEAFLRLNNVKQLELAEKLQISPKYM